MISNVATEKNVSAGPKPLTQMGNGFELYYHTYSTTLAWIILITYSKIDIV